MAARMKRSFLLIGLLALAAAPVSAKVIYVDDDANGLNNGTSWGNAYQFLQDALADAKTAEKPVEIRVAQGTYKPDRDSAHLQGGSSLPYFMLYDEMSLLGGYGRVGALDPNSRHFTAYQTVLSGDLRGNDALGTDLAKLRYDPTRADNSPVLWMRRNSKGHIKLEGCLITGGSNTALVVQSPDDAIVDPNLTIANCTFRGNTGTYGWRNELIRAAALEAWGNSRPTITRCAFIENAGEGGGIGGSGIVLSNCEFAGNCGGSGAGAALGDSTISDCIFTENRTEAFGGALSLRGSSTILRCVFRNNSASSGGAIRSQGDVDIKDCVFVGNEARLGAGACSLIDRAKATMSGCMIVGNRGLSVGGAWSMGLGTSLNMTNCTISQNRSSQGGGAFLAIGHGSEPNSGAVKILNCIMADGSKELWSDGAPIEVAYTCITKGGVDVNDPNGWLVWGPANVVADPCFTKAGYWDPNGTSDDPNDDYFVEGDHHLKSQAGRWDPNSHSWVIDDVTSPCIDAGDPNSPVGDEAEPNGGRINMGAYGGTVEASKSMQAGGSRI